MQKKIRLINFIAISSIIIILFSYRDFLYTIKLMIFHFYNYQILPIDPYYKIILKYAGIIDENFRFPWEWRIIPNLINWLVYEVVPCVKPKIIPKEIANTTKRRKKMILNQTLVDNAFKESAPKSPTITDPSNT